VEVKHGSVFALNKDFYGALLGLLVAGEQDGGKEGNR